MLKENIFTFPKLTTWKKTQLLGHAKKLLTAQHEILQKTDNSILHYTLQNKTQHEYMKHYPKGDRIDHQTGAQYFYHCHREDIKSTEHGHFHCFLRYKNIPKHIKPTPLKDWDKHIDNPMTHIIAIAMNNLGQPIRLFTVNRCVSSEIWYDSKHASKFINRFKITKVDDPYWIILDQWVTSMLKLFAPQICWLYNQRDATIRSLQYTYPDCNVYENENYEELSSININLHDHIQWIINSPV